MKKFLKYLIFAVIAIIIAKWIIMFLPLNNNNIKTNINCVKPKKEIKEVELSLDF